jgi:hypothetical protein
MAVSCHPTNTPHFIQAGNLPEVFCTTVCVVELTTVVVTGFGTGTVVVVVAGFGVVDVASVVNVTVVVVIIVVVVVAIATVVVAGVSSALEHSGSIVVTLLEYVRAPPL